VFEWAKNYTQQVKAQLIRKEYKQKQSDQGSGEASAASISRSENSLMMKYNYRSKPMDMKLQNGDIPS
jgi:hypothetical protein